MKTAEELGIKEYELQALIEVRDKLANGTFVYRKEPDPDNPTDKPIFNMLWWFNGKGANENESDEFLNEWKCGTVGCIGGWMCNTTVIKSKFEDFLKENPEEFGDKPGEWFLNGHFHNLFYPYEFEDEEWPNLTPNLAIKAIDRFLEGYVFPWSMEETKDFAPYTDEVEWKDRVNATT